MTEETKAIVELNHFSNITAYWKKQEYTNSEINSYIKIVLNLIEKQQKELREMRKAIDIKNAEIECLNVIHESYKEMVEENNYISKDKLIELREIDNIDLIQFKLRKLLEE